MWFSLFSCTLLLITWISSKSNAQEGEVKLQYFRTEPDFNTPLIEITKKTNDSSLLAPGFIFYGPRNSHTTRAPLIIDNDANIIWYGFGWLGERSQRGQDLHVCDFKGETGKHICFSDLFYNPFPKGPHHVLNNKYEEVDYSEVINDFGWPNVHENNDVKGGESFLQAIFPSKQFNLTDYGLMEDGWITDGCIQEVSTRTHEEIFRWCASDYFPLWVTYIYPKAPQGKEQVNGTLGYAGTGEQKHPWDWIHLNSIDKNEEGDYLVSARHWDTIIKVAGPNSQQVHGVEPGTILWRLGGRFSDFELPDDAKFFRQHHVRFLKTTTTETTVTIFNNAADGSHKMDPPIADGRIVAVNNETKQASLVQKFPHPKGFNCASQGSMSVYENGNAMVGWGYCTNPSFNEFAPDGTVLLQGSVPGGPSYRARKYNWTAFPDWKPKLIAYAPSCRDAKVIAYVSWNGATEVKKWRLYTGMSARGQWKLAGDVSKSGFETTITASEHFVPYIFIQAIDGNGKVLGDVSAKTWIPAPNSSPQNLTCDEVGCGSARDRFRYDPKLNYSDTCSNSSLFGPFIGLLLAVALIECCNYFGSNVLEFVTTAVVERARHGGKVPIWSAAGERIFL